MGSGMPWRLTAQKAYLSGHNGHAAPVAAARTRGLALMSMIVVTVVGARPQFVKAAVVSRALRATATVSEILVPRASTTTRGCLTSSASSASLLRPTTPYRFTPLTALRRGECRAHRGHPAGDHAGLGGRLRRHQLHLCGSPRRRETPRAVAHVEAGALAQPSHARGSEPGPHRSPSTVLFTRPRPP